VIFKAHTTVYVQKLWSIVHLPQNQNQSWHCNFLVFVMVHFKIDILSGLDTGQVALPCSLISFWLFRVICTSDYSHDLTILSCRLAPPPPVSGTDNAATAMQHAAPPHVNQLTKQLNPQFHIHSYVN